MISQIAPVKNVTQSLSHLNKGLLQVRHIQARLHEHERAPVADLPKTGELWSPMTAGPYLVPVVQWFD
jgi:hypothetical protein